MMLLHEEPGLLWFSVKPTARLPWQLSRAVTLAGGGTSSMHWTVISAGQPERTGGVVSLTTMSWVQDVELPHASVAV